MDAEVALAHCAEQCTRHRVQQHVAIGVALEPAVVRNQHPAEHERAIRHERVRVEAVADPHPRHSDRLRSASCWSSLAFGSLRDV